MRSRCKGAYIDQNYRIGAAAQSTYGRDYSTAGATGYFELGMRDLAAFGDGFSYIAIGHSDARYMAMGDVENKDVGKFHFNAMLTDRAIFKADSIKVMGDVHSTDLLTIEGRLMEVQSKNVQDPMGPADSGITAKEVYIDLSEQMVLSGWVRGEEKVTVNVQGSTGENVIVGYGTEPNGFTADQGSALYTTGDGSSVKVITSASIVSATGIYAMGEGSAVEMIAGTGMTILEGAAISVQENNSSITLSSVTYLHLNSGSAVLAGAHFKYEGSTPVPVKDGENTSITITTEGELKLSGSVTANGELAITAGDTFNSFAGLFRHSSRQDPWRDR